MNSGSAPLAVLLAAALAGLTLLQGACSLRDYDKLTDGRGVNDGGDSGATLDPEMLAWWKLDEGSGTVAVDSSGHGNGGVLGGGASWVAGRISGATAFDGASGRITVPSSPSLQTATDTVTVALWVNADEAPTVDERLLRMGYVWELKLDGPARNPRLSAGVSGRVATLAYSLALGEWHHIAFTLDHGKVTGYIDGTSAPFKDNSFADMAPLGVDNFPLVLGASQVDVNAYVDYCKCRLDDVRLYRRVLSAPEIQALAR